jgi:TRAP-type C4-dicarboxylate transport system substrate-binding protein
MNKNIDLDVVIVGMPHVITYLNHSKKHLKGKVEDFKNSLVRNAGGAYDLSFKALGCATVKMAAPETYMALQKGTLDGALTAYTKYM